MVGFVIPKHYGTIDTENIIKGISKLLMDIYQYSCYVELT
jgi:hypothetical protein